MALPNNKTKIVATIGPASEPPEMLERLICAGLNVARLNFSHGDLASHAERIKHIRSAAEAVGRRVAVMQQKATMCDLCSDLDGQPSCVYACPHDAAHRMSGKELLAHVERSRT